MSTNADTAPFSAFEWLLAGRYLRPRRKEGFISVIAIFSFLGVTLGVMTLIVVMAVMNGFRQELYTKLLGLNGHLSVVKIGEPFTDYEETAGRLATVPGVVAVMPVIEGQALFTNPALPGHSTGVYVRGMKAHDIESLKLVAGGLRAGTLEGFDEGSSIVLGFLLARNLGVNVGDSVKLVTSRGKSTIFGEKPNVKVYQVAAVIEIGMASYDSTIAFLPLHESQLYFNYPGQANLLEVLVEDPQQVGTLGPMLKTAAGVSYFVSDWRERNKDLFTVIDTERNVMFMILSLIVVVATFNVISGLMMLVKDKGRDIAILRTMGATSGAMMRVFLITGASIGVVGSIVGFLLGVLICRNIEEIQAFIAWTTGVGFSPTAYYISRLPAQMNPWETGAIVLTSLLLSVLATLYPSWRASRLDPVEALRYE